MLLKILALGNQQVMSTAAWAIEIGIAGTGEMLRTASRAGIFRLTPNELGISFHR